jgi:hypothetical protein
MAQGVEGNVPGENQLVVALVVGEGGRVEGPGRQHLGIGGGRPAGVSRMWSSSRSCPKAVNRSATVASAADHDQDLEAVTSLAQPVRRALYDFVAGSVEPVSPTLARQHQPTIQRPAPKANRRTEAQ